MERTGTCLCGAVRYAATIAKPNFSACHCSMCLRWAGGPFLSVTTEKVSFEGEEHIGVFTSSDWAERGVCKQCGSALFYRMTAPGPTQGVTAVSLGSLDDKEGLRFSLEWFIDEKPEGYEFMGERKTLTSAEIHAMFGGG